MKSLTLFRHAKSSWDNHGLADNERPLSKRGLRDAPRMAERLVQRGLLPELLLTSTAVRAEQTTEFIAAAFGEAAIEIRHEPNLYLASPGDLLEVLSGVSDNINALVLIGHNPGLTQLANMLLRDLSLFNLPTAGVVAIHCATDSWRTIESAQFRLHFYDFPKNPDPSGNGLR